MPDSMIHMMARMIDFYDNFIKIGKTLGEKDTVVIVGDSNGHTGSNAGHYEGYGYGITNQEGEIILKFCVSY